MKNNLGYLVDILERFLWYFSLTAVMAALCLAMGGCGMAGEEESEPRSFSGKESTALLGDERTASGEKDAADSGEEDAAEPRDEEHMEISVAYWQIDEALKNRDGDEVLKTLEEKFNITIVPRNITWDDYYSKIRLWAETGELPDLFVGAHRMSLDFSRWVKEGLLHEIPSDLSAYPNLAQYMDSPESAQCMIDDRLYCIFRQTYSEQAETVKDRTIAYRWDLARAAGITEEPENWEEFQDMITAIMEADSEGKQIGGMTAKDFNMLMGPLFTYSIPLASPGGVSFYWVPQGEGYVPALFAGEELGSDALPTWRLVREMYERGVIEKDIFLSTTAQAEEKFLMGKSAAICFDGGIGNSKTYENMIQYWEEVHGSEFLEDVRFLDLMPSVNGELYYTVWDYAWSESYINSRVSEEKLDRILALYDYLLSVEGYRFSHFGIEGVSYRAEEDGSIVLLTKEPPSALYPSIAMMGSLVSWNSGIQQETEGSLVVPQKYREEDEKRVERARECRIPAYEYECSMIASRMEDSFSIDTNRIFQQIVLGTEPEEEIWAEIIEEYKEEGLMETIEEVNRRMREE